MSDNDGDIAFARIGEHAASNGGGQVQDQMPATQQIPRDTPRPSPSPRMPLADKVWLSIFCVRALVVLSTCGMDFYVAYGSGSSKVTRGEYGFKLLMLNSAISVFWTFLTGLRFLSKGVRRVIPSEVMVAGDIVLLVFAGSIFSLSTRSMIISSTRPTRYQNASLGLNTTWLVIDVHMAFYSLMTIRSSLRADDELRGTPATVRIDRSLNLPTTLWDALCDFVGSLIWIFVSFAIVVVQLLLFPFAIWDAIWEYGVKTGLWAGIKTRWEAFRNGFGDVWRWFAGHIGSAVGVIGNWTVPAFIIPRHARLASSEDRNAEEGLAHNRGSA